MEESSSLIDAAVHGRRPARTPIFDLLRNDAVIERFGGRPLGRGDDERTVELAAANALDATRSLATPDVPGRKWTDDLGNEWEAARWTRWVLRPPCRSEEEWLAAIPRWIEQAEAQPPPAEDAILRARREQQSLNRRLGGTVPIHATPSTAINMALFGYHLGLETFAYLWADQRDLLLRWLKAIQRQQHHLLLQDCHRDFSPLAMIYSDIAYRQRMMFSRPMLEEMSFFDEVAATCDTIHGRGMLAIFHSDGNIADILPDLVAAGIDGLNPIEKAAGMDIYAIRRSYPELVLVGGVDVSHLLPFGAPQEVRREVRRIINECGSEGRLLIGSSTEVDDAVPLANYLAMHQEIMDG